MRTYRIKTNQPARAVAQPPDRGELSRWLLLGGLGLGLTALALAPLAQAEDLMDINGQPRWVAALEIPVWRLRWKGHGPASALWV